MRCVREVREVFFACCIGLEIRAGILLAPGPSVPTCHASAEPYLVGASGRSAVLALNPFRPVVVYRLPGSSSVP